MPSKGNQKKRSFVKATEVRDNVLNEVSRNIDYDDTYDIPALVSNTPDYLYEDAKRTCKDSESHKDLSTDFIYYPQRSSTDKFNHARAQELCEVRDHLDALNDKMKAFSKLSDGYRDNNNSAEAKTYRKAANAAGLLHYNINLLCIDYEHNKMNLNSFQSTAARYLSDENKLVVMLNTHRGYKDVVANLLIAITGVGLLAMAAASIYNGRLTMFKVTSTDAGSKVNALADSVERVLEAPAFK